MAGMKIQPIKVDKHGAINIDDLKSKVSIYVYSMCSLAVSTQDSPAVEPRLNPGSGKILNSENLRLYTTPPCSCHVLIDKALSSD